MQTPIHNKSSRTGWAILLFLLALAAELFLSNFYAVYNRLFYSEHVYSRADMSTSENRENIREDGSFLVDFDHVSLSFQALGSAVHSVSFRLQYADGGETLSLPCAELGGYDENCSEDYVIYATQTLCAGTRNPTENVIRLSTHGTPSQLVLVFDSEAELLVSDLRFNAPEGFSFSPLRFLVFLLIAALLWVGKCTSWFRRQLKPSTQEGKTVLAVLLAFSLLGSLTVAFFFMGRNSLGVISYPPVSAVEHYSPYVQQFDAFQKGQLHLDLRVSDDLLAMENPYDTSLREQEADYFWDRAFYEGKYYSYFGIAPILTLYYPFYLLGGVLPGDGLVLTVFSALAAIFTVLCLWELVKLTKKRLTVSHFLLGTLACLFASMIWLMQRGVDRFYYIASLSAMAFGAITFYCLLKALFHPHTLKRRLWLIGAALAYSLLLLSRINTALFYSVLVLCLLFVFIKRNRNRPSALALDLVCPVLLVLCCIAFQLIFNALRFHNPLEFGTRYQLTVSNPSFNSLGAENLLPTLYHYFFEPISWSTTFPFAGFSTRLLPAYGHYVYLAETNFGLLSIPLFWALFAFGALFQKRSLPKAYRRICLILLLCLPLTAFLNYSLGGSILRYVADLAPLAAILSTMILWELCDGASTRPPCHSERCVLTATKGLFFATVAAGFFLLCIRDCADLAAYSPEVFAALQGVFSM